MLKKKKKIHIKQTETKQTQKMSRSSDETSKTTTTTTTMTATNNPTQAPLPSVSTTLHQQAGQQKGEEPRQQSRCIKEKSNRHKILTDDGTARFGTIYNASPLPHKAARPIQLTKYTAVRDIKKSAAAKKNKVKIARAGESVYVLGDPVCGSRAEVFVFKEGSKGCVYKRVWEDVKEGLRVCGDVVVTVSVEAEGVAGKEAEGRWLQVELGRSKEAEVWVSERWWDAKMRMKTRTMGSSNEEEEEEEGECLGQPDTLFGARRRMTTRSVDACACGDIFPIHEDGNDMVDEVYVDVDDSLWPF